MLLKRHAGALILCSLVIGMLVVALATLRLPALAGHTSEEAARELARLQAELPGARARWAAHRLADYAIDVRLLNGQCPWVEQPVHLDVCGGEVLTVTLHPADADYRMREYGTRTLALGECQVSMLSIDRMLARAERMAATTDPHTNYVRVRFDPVAGYVSEYMAASLETAGRAPLAALLMPPGDAPAAGMAETYAFSNFRPAAAPCSPKSSQP